MVRSDVAVGTPEVAAERVTWRSPVLAWGALVGVVVLALGLFTWDLGAAGYGNLYYAAAARSMSASWSNFFFGALDPGGFMTIDKPPLFLWPGVLLARVFGYSGEALILPNAVAGAATVALLWLIVRRWYGARAATVAAVVLALTPVTVVMSRLNGPEPFLTLLLVGAAGCVMMACGARNWGGWVVAAGVLVGLAFNTKMLAAWVVGPALALALILAMPWITPEHTRRVLAQLGVLLVATIVVSGSWLGVVEAWPESDRPYVGGSDENSAFELAFGYNGLERVGGDGGGAQAGGDGGFAVPAAGLPTGAPGPLRMFDEENGSQIGWLLPLAIGGGVMAVWWWRRDPGRRALAGLFLTWVLSYGVAFSVAGGIYHSYYTAVMAPAVAALVGMGLVTAVLAVRQDWRWLVPVVGVSVVTAWAQLEIAGQTPDYYRWVRPFLVILAVAGLALAVVLASRGRAAVGLAVALVGLLLIPAAWSLSEATNAPESAILAAAGPAADDSLPLSREEARPDDAPLVEWLRENNDPEARWLVAVPGALDGAPLIAEHGIPVMGIGGFDNEDPSLTVEEFFGLVGEGEVRYALRTGILIGLEGLAADVFEAVQERCRPVDAGLPERYAGTLYDCLVEG